MGSTGTQESRAVQQGRDRRDSQATRDSRDQRDRRDGDARDSRDRDSRDRDDRDNRDDRDDRDDRDGYDSRVVAKGGLAGGSPMRADARRNRGRLLAAAREAFAAHGADAPLDEIARQAEVGIGTLYRHFPTRLALQEAVYRDQVQSLCAIADELREDSSPGEALETWMRELVGYVATKRGLSQTLINSLGKDSAFLSSCSSLIRETGGELLESAKRSGAVRPDAEITDVMRLCHAIVLASEQAGEPAGSAGRLVSLVLDGLRRSEGATS